MCERTYSLSNKLMVTREFIDNDLRLVGVSDLRFYITDSKNMERDVIDGEISISIIKNYEAIKICIYKFTLDTTEGFNKELIAQNIIQNSDQSQQISGFVNFMFECNIFTKCMSDARLKLSFI